MVILHFDYVDFPFVENQVVSVIDVTPGPGLNRINRRLIPISCNFFSGSPFLKNSKVKHAWPGEI